MDHKEFSKWLWDIAKYIVTVIIVSTFLGRFDSNLALLYGVSIAVAGALFGLGVYFQKQSKKNDNGNNFK